MDDLQGHRTPPQSPRPSTPRSLSRSQSPSRRSLSPPPDPPLGTPPLPPPLDFDRANSESGSEQDLLLEEAFPLAHLPKLRTAIRFIEAIETVSLASHFDPEELEELLEPQEHNSSPLDDPKLKLSLLNYISLLDTSHNKYEAIRKNTEKCLNGVKLLSHYQVERRTKLLSGLVTWEHHMCFNSCLGFTGPYSDLDRCPECGEHCYDQKQLQESEGLRKEPRKVFTTFPVGPQLQARWNNPQMAKEMLYRWRKTEEVLVELEATGELPDLLDNILCGKDYINLARNGKIKKFDSVLMLSTNGAQLYDNKQSDIWIYIWIILDLSPDKRYKIQNVLPGGVIPGPEPPSDYDSFLFPGIAHVSALQKERLPIWDALSREHQLSKLFILLILADSIGMGPISGSVGHHGRKGCQLLCRFKGRNKIRGPHYYPALLRPDGFEDH